MPTNNPVGSDYLAQVFLLGSTSAQYVRFDITAGCPQANSGFDGCGIGEVAFSVVNSVPVPAALPLMSSALAMFGLGRRRNILG